MLALQAMTPGALADAVAGVTLAEARKLVAMIHRGEPVAASSAVRRSAAQAVRAAGEVPALGVVAETASAIDPFVKYLLAGPDGARFEAVRIPLLAGRFSVCVSSQVGCALACAFCATGRLGLARNLAAWEIVEQVRVVRARLPAGRVPAKGGPSPLKGDPRARESPILTSRRGDRSIALGSDQGVAHPCFAADGRSIDRPRVSGVVFQGMGEPLANADAVLAAIAVMTEPCALGIDARAITVCTAGLPSGIRRLAAEAPQVRLAISIGSARDDARRSLMPIGERHPLDAVLDAAAEHARATGHAPMWAVTLLDGVNDAAADARALVERALAFHAATGKRPRLSIIAYNSIGAGDPFRRSSRERAFRDVLAAAGLPSHRRYSGGSDVAAACGQLAAISSSVA